MAKFDSTRRTSSTMTMMTLFYLTVEYISKHKFNGDDVKWQDGVASIRTFFSCDDVHGSSIWFNCQSDSSQIIIFLNQYFAVFDIKTWNDPIYS